MNVFLVYIQDENYYRLLSDESPGSCSEDGRLKVMGFPPLSIQTLAPVLRRRGHSVRLFDTCHPQMKAEHIAACATQMKPNVIGLSFLSTTTYPATKELARQLKAVAPRVPIIVGGPFATFSGRQILEDCGSIDAVGVGEGEELLPDYLDHLEAPSSVAGLIWRDGKVVVTNAPRSVIPDLDQFPYPDRSSLPIDYVESLPLDVPAVLSMDKFCTIQTSRGCPYSCVYCDIPSLSDGKWRSRSPEHVLGEMQELNDAGYRSIYLTDDHFLLNRQRIGAICKGIVARNLRFKWGCEGRVDSVAIDQFPNMAKAGCNSLAFGIEAGTQKVLDRLNKKQTLAQVTHAVSEAKKHGIERAHGFFVIGSPGETEADIMESFRFAARLDLDTFGFNRLCVYRGTPLWEEYIERGVIDDGRDWHKWFKCSDIDPTVLPSAMLNRVRMKGYALLFTRRLFGRPIQTLQLLRKLSQHMKRRDVLRLLASPFRRRRLTRKPELPAKMTDCGLTKPVRGQVLTT